MLNDILYQVEAVNFVLYTHIEGGGDSPLFLISVNIQIPVVPVVGELMDQGRISVEVKYDGFIFGNSAS